MKTTNLSGHDIYCLAQLGYQPGSLIIENSVYSPGIIRSLSHGLRLSPGKEIPSLTQFLAQSRKNTFQRMKNTVLTEQSASLIDVTNHIVMRSGYLEFLAQGTLIHPSDKNNTASFSTTLSGQDCLACFDADYQPISVVSSNVAYATGLHQGLFNSLKNLAQGEIKSFSDQFNHTRHLALERLIAQAKAEQANVVIDITTTLLPIGKACDMVMTGTAAHHPLLSTQNDIITSNLTPVEMWNLAKTGYAPLRLLLGSSVFSLGLAGSMNAALKSFSRDEMDKASNIISRARENALALIQHDAKKVGADHVIGVKTSVYPLGNGLMECLAMGTAIQKLPTIKTRSEQLPLQAVIVDKKMFRYGASNVDAKKSSLGGILLRFIVIIAVLIVIAGLAIKM
jgi:uncharacterized protein YbjQ (UPF0145 family)